MWGQNQKYKNQSTVSTDYDDLVIRVDYHSYRVVGDALASDLTNEITIVVEYLDAKGTIFAYMIE